MSGPVTIYRLYTVPQTFSSTCTGLPALSWTSGLTYTAQEVVARLTAAFSTRVSFSIDNAVGIVHLTHPIGIVPPFTFAFGHASLQQFLGFSAPTFDQTKTDGDDYVLGWWHGHVATPWAATGREEWDDVVNVAGRTTQTGTGSERQQVSIRLWLHRRSDATTFLADLTRAYQAADDWVDGPLSLTEADDTDHWWALSEGWEMAPLSLDAVTVALDVEGQEWQSA
jgi:hypothetical protein